MQADFDKLDELKPHHTRLVQIEMQDSPARERDLKREREELEGIVDDYDNASRALEQISSEVRNLNQFSGNVSEIEFTLKSYTAHKSDLDTLRLAANTDVDDNTPNTATLKQNRDTAQGTLNEARKTHADVQSRLELLRKKNEALQTERFKHKGDTLTLREQLTQAEGDEKKKAENLQKIKSIAAELKTEEYELADRRKTRVDFERRLAEFKTKSDALAKREQDAINSMAQAAGRLRDKMRSVDEIPGTAHDEMQELKEQMEELQAKCKEEQARMADLSAQLEHTKQMLENKKSYQVCV